MTTPAIKHGAPCWVDLAVPDVAQAVAYYGRVFGWTHTPSPTGRPDYSMFLSDGEPVAGIHEIHNDPPAARWRIHFSTRDIERSCQIIADDGGTINSGPERVLDRGLSAICTDQRGATFGLWQPDKCYGFAAASPSHKGFLYCTLRSRAAREAMRLYGECFGWRYGTGRLPTHHPFGVGRFGSGTIVDVQAELPSDLEDYWSPYFEVDDIDATAAIALNQGGAILSGPYEVPGAGRLLELSGPQGSWFFLISRTAVA